MSGCLATGLCERERLGCTGLSARSARVVSVLAAGLCERGLECIRDVSVLPVGLCDRCLECARGVASVDAELDERLCLVLSAMSVDAPRRTEDDFAGLEVRSVRVISIVAAGFCERGPGCARCGASVGEGLEARRVCVVLSVLPVDARRRAVEDASGAIGDGERDRTLLAVAASSVCEKKYVVVGSRPERRERQESVDSMLLVRTKRSVLTSRAIATAVATAFCAAATLLEHSADPPEKRRRDRDDRSSARSSALH